MSGIPLTAAYLIGIPSIMLGSILFVGGIRLVLRPLPEARLASGFRHFRAESSTLVAAHISKKEARQSREE
jgi:hypothetical protein